jgi:hypothetical protein
MDPGMHRSIPLALLSVGCAQAPAASPATASGDHGPRSERELVVESIVAVARLDLLAPDLVARCLGSRIERDEQVTPYRRDVHLAPTSRFASVEVVEGGEGPWRAVTLRPAAGITLELEDFAPHLLDARYATSVQITHRDGPAPGAVVHRFAVRAGELVVSVGLAPRDGGPRDRLGGAYRDGIDQAAGAGREAITSIVVTSTTDLPADAMTLRELRRWAAEHP